MSNDSPSRTWSVIPYNHSDLPAIGLYFKQHIRNASEYGSMGLFQWRTVDNYIMPGIINLIKDGERIVATLSNTPKRLFVNGEGRLVAEIGDANTDPQYQRQGMLALLINQSTRDALGKGIQGVYSAPDTHTPSLPAFIKKANFLPQQDLDIESLTFPIDIGPLLKGRTHWLFSHYMGSFFLTLSYLYYLVMKGLNPMSRGFTVHEMQELPDDWDSFWDKARRSYDFIFERNREALTWRFFSNPNKYQFLIMRSKDEIIGYMVYRIINDGDTKRFIIADYLLLPGYEAHFKLLLLRGFEVALRRGASLISSWCIKGSMYSKFFKSLGFIKRNHIVLIWFQNEFALNLKTTHRFHFTISDSDNV